MLLLRFTHTHCCHPINYPLLQKKGRVWGTAYTNCVPLHRTVWPNHITVSCHMTHYTLTILLGEHMHFAAGISRVHYLKSSYII